MSSVGIFATAAALDHFWRAAPGRPARTTTRRPVAGNPVLPPAPPPTQVRFTTTPPTAAPAPDSCIGTFTFTLQLGTDGAQHEQTFVLHNAPEGGQESLQCNAGPYRYGTLDMLCQNGGWVMAGSGSPCSDTEAGATQNMGGDRVGGFRPANEHVLQLVDVSAIVARLHEEDEDSTMKCCCNARLDANLRANSWSHRRWNRRDHTGICTIYANVRSCSRTNSETHSAWRTEGGQCIVRQDEEANWRPILQLNQQSHSSQPIRPNVPTVSRQGAAEYENCVPPHSIGECERCTHNVHCAEGWHCCPFMKLCVENGETQCPTRLIAGCSQCFERWAPNPEHCAGRCDNPSFPHTWLPACSSGWLR